MTVRVTLRVAREASSRAKGEKTPRVAREAISIAKGESNIEGSRRDYIEGSRQRVIKGKREATSTVAWMVAI